jgi:hypothetical protein
VIVRWIPGGERPGPEHCGRLQLPAQGHVSRSPCELTLRSGSHSCGLLVTRCNSNSGSYYGNPDFRVTINTLPTLCHNCINKLLFLRNLKHGKHAFFCEFSGKLYQHCVTLASVYLIHFRSRHCSLQKIDCHYIDNFLLLVAAVGKVLVE